MFYFEGAMCTKVWTHGSLFFSKKFVSRAPYAVSAPQWHSGNFLFALSIHEYSMTTFDLQNWKQGARFRGQKLL